MIEVDREKGQTIEEEVREFHAKEDALDVLIEFEKLILLLNVDREMLAQIDERKQPLPIVNIVVRFVVERDDEDRPKVPEEKVEQQKSADTAGVQREIAQIHDPRTFDVKKHQYDQLDRRQVDDQRFQKREKVPFLVRIDVALIVIGIDETTIWW